ncbi:DUF1294 domain-containing protein [Parasedimentitalea psychrophila]|uniref:DUF1294 domain-containing protein n=1 Tax=Parasedimentitalea psychrophila TaxID=2997337 RepID=A0A9Y2L3I3_9RHOB|nr:DUF1294 domain-containing protein [Parasedimentitalea psychrophila]WIY27006.1 DUF1294 domain-containing protein [Parasedimentitalea psychrophila]
MMDFPWLVVLLYLLAINTLTLALFALDKHRARHRRWRISEQSLLLSCLLGGTPGAYWARKRFRHKTRKQPFSSQLHMIAGLQLLAGLGAIWLILSGKDL